MSINFFGNNSLDKLLSLIKDKFDKTIENKATEANDISIKTNNNGDIEIDGKNVYLRGTNTVFAASSTTIDKLYVREMLKVRGSIEDWSTSDDYYPLTLKSSNRLDLKASTLKNIGFYTTDSVNPTTTVQDILDDIDGKADESHTHTKSQITDFPTLATVATSGSYNDLSNKPTIPTNTNQLTNGAGYITSSGTSKTISDTLPVSKGGTGATTAANARTNLGLGGAATYSATSSVTSGSSALVTSGAVYSAVNGVVTHTTNTNGTYFKYSDGTLICTKTVTTKQNFTTAWGSMYECSSVSLGSWAYTFSAKPRVFAETSLPQAGYSTAFIETWQNVSTTSAGSAQFCRPTSSSNVNLSIDIMAIGTWK